MCQQCSPTSAAQTQGPTCQVKRGLKDDGRAPLPVAYAAVDPCIARPDLSQQQGPVGKHSGSAEVRRTTKRRERYLEGNEMEPHAAKARGTGRNWPGTGQREGSPHATSGCVCVYTRTCVYSFMFVHRCVPPTADSAFGVAR